MAICVCWWPFGVFHCNWQQYQSLLPLLVTSSSEVISDSQRHGWGLARVGWMGWGGCRMEEKSGPWQYPCPPDLNAVPYSLLFPLLSSDLCQQTSWQRSEKSLWGSEGLLWEGSLAALHRIQDMIHWLGDGWTDWAAILGNKNNIYLVTWWLWLWWWRWWRYLCVCAHACVPNTLWYQLRAVFLN